MNSHLKKIKVILLSSCLLLSCDNSDSKISNSNNTNPNIANFNLELNPITINQSKSIRFTWNAIDPKKELTDLTLCMHDVNVEKYCNEIAQVTSSGSYEIKNESLIESFVSYAEKDFYLRAQLKDGSNIDSNNVKIAKTEFDKNIISIKTTETCNDEKSESIPENFNWGEDIATNEDNSIIAVSAKSATVNGISGVGCVYVYENKRLITKLLPPESNIITNLNFGEAIAVSADGTTIFVTAIHDSSEYHHKGIFFVFHKNSEGNWEIVPNKTFSPSYDKTNNLMFGKDIASNIDGSFIAVSSKANRRVYTFEWSKEDNKWNDFHSGIIISEGSKVIFNKSADFLLIGNDTSNFSKGLVRIFKKAEQLWEYQTDITPIKQSSFDFFGFNFTFTSDLKNIVASAYGEGPTNIHNIKYPEGAAYLFEKNEEGNWIQTTYFKSSNPKHNQNFGYSPTINNNATLITVSSINNASNDIGINHQPTSGSNNIGAIHYFKKINDEWKEVAFIKAPNNVKRFGHTVILSKDENQLITASSDGTLYFY